MIRVSSEDKAAIKSAADSLGKSLTTFITEAATKKAAQVKKAPPARGVHGGLPSWFRATCFEAAHGGARGYFSAGLKLAGSLGSEMPWDVDEQEWASEVEALQELLANDDDKEILTWFKRHYPRWIDLVPVRRRQQFVEGVREAHDRGDIEL